MILTRKQASTTLIVFGILLLIIGYLIRLQSKRMPVRPVSPSSKYEPTLLAGTLFLIIGLFIGVVGRS